MKTILVPTDFSKTSKNAVRYAAGMAVDVKAKLVLLNVQDIAANPLGSIHLHYPSTDAALVESASKLELAKEKKQIENMYGQNLIMEIVFKRGFVTEEINKYSRENQVDLVVMGIHSANYFTERFLGSMPTMILRKTTQPLLIVDESMVYKSWEKMILTFDGLEANHDKVFRPLKQLIRLFHLKLFILHISPENRSDPDANKEELAKLENELEEIEHSVHFRTGSDLIGEINEFINEIKGDVVVMIPRKHSLLDGIFEEANTKRMAFHSKVPLLCLHE